MFYGFACNIDEIKFFEGIDILWIEEVYNFIVEMWKILELIIKCNEGVECWVVFNFNLVMDFVY